MLLASDFDKSKYFRAPDLDREKKFRIKTVTSDTLTDKKGNKEEKLIVWFDNDPRGLPLNKTNLRTLKGAFGDNTANWATKVIAIPPPRQAAAAASPTQSAAPSGNGAATPSPAVVTAAVVDPELEPDPKLSIKDELNDEIPENW